MRACVCICMCNGLHYRSALGKPALNPRRRIDYARFLLTLSIPRPHFADGLRTQSRPVIRRDYREKHFHRDKESRTTLFLRPRCHRIGSPPVVPGAPRVHAESNTWTFIFCEQYSLYINRYGISTHIDSSFSTSKLCFAKNRFYVPQINF